MSDTSIKITADSTKNNILEMIDEWAGRKNTTRHRAAVQIFSAALLDPIEVSFDDNLVIVGFSKAYVEACRAANKSDQEIVHNSVSIGLKRLETSI